jgi:hypothetical protein
VEGDGEGPDFASVTIENKKKKPARRKDKAPAFDATNADVFVVMRKGPRNILRSKLGSGCCFVAVAEAIDEAAISAAGQTFTKFRTAMSPVTLEQVTVVRMFIRRKGFSRSTFNGWYQDQKRQHVVKEKALKEANRAAARAEKK